jgi:hypothetical protein
MRGPLRSLTLAWDPSGWQARPGTGRSPALEYFRTRQLDVNGGGGWKLIATGQTIDLQFGSPLQFKMPPVGGGPTGRHVAQTDETATTTETTAPPEPAPVEVPEVVDEGTPTTTVAEPPVEPPVEAPTTTVDEAPATTVAEPIAPPPTTVPDEAPATTAAPAPAETPLTTDELGVDGSVETMVIDMSAAATVSIGDRYGFFTVVDGQTA